MVFGKLKSVLFIFQIETASAASDNDEAIDEEDGEDTDDEEEDDSDNEADEEIPAVLKGSTSSIALGEENSTIMVSWHTG